ncbi:hypothetical protein CMI38_02375 [Candidatus Pacearchaeota archaeon]|nr:hypothetical protein [Candidatus Pacearchaeota archaeon]|tara:strand:- start:1883 stop:2122 length:240 start_codon:yes stop_codon:yes gene_type:complete
MKIIRMEDIEREKHVEKRDKIVDDVNYVVEGVLGKGKKKESNWLWFIAKLVLGLLVLVAAVNFVLGNVWLLKFFYGELF